MKKLRGTQSRPTAILDRDKSLHSHNQTKPDDVPKEPADSLTQTSQNQPQKPFLERWQYVIALVASVIIPVLIFILVEFDVIERIRGNEADHSPAATPTLALPSGSSSLQVPAGQFDITLTYEGRHAYTMVINANSNLNGLTLHGGENAPRLVAQDFPSVQQLNGQMIGGACLRYIREGQEPTLPTICEGKQVFERAVAESDVFWFDSTRNLPLDLFVQVEGTSLGFCTTAAGQCDFVQP